MMEALARMEPFDSGHASVRIGNGLIAKSKENALVDAEKG